MKIRSIADLNAELDKDLGWRKKELITIKLLHAAARGHEQEMLRRAGVALLYAHWEGYVKSAGTNYVEFVARQRLKYHDLKHNFVAIGVRTQLEQFAATASGAILCEVANFFINRLHEQATLAWDRAIQTKSNLSAERTRDIILLLGLNYQPFEVVEASVIERLRNLRNEIAHGRRMPVTPVEFDELHVKIMGLIDELTTQIINSATTKSYRKPADPPIGK